MTQKKTVVWITVLAFVILIIIGVINQNRRDKALIDAIPVVATITNSYNVHGPETIEVQFVLNGEVVNSAFSTYDWKGLIVGKKVNILASKQKPETYVKFVSLVK